MARRLEKIVPADQPVKELELPPDKKPLVRIRKRDVYRTIALCGIAAAVVGLIALFATQPKAQPSPRAVNASLLGSSIEATEATVADITIPKRDENQPWPDEEPKKKDKKTTDEKEPSAKTDEEKNETAPPKDTEKAAAETTEEAPAANATPAPQEGEAEPEPEPEPQPVSEPSEEIVHEGGVLTREGGVNYFDGHRETWYSQRVLPGEGLAIPGRHVADDGTVRDGDDYIVVASDDLPKGSLVETSLGTGKVYDSFGGYNQGTGNVDIYVDW